MFKKLFFFVQIFIEICPKKLRTEGFTAVKSCINV